MSTYNIIKIANQVRASIKSGQSFGLPIMSGSDFSKVMRMLKSRISE